MTEATEQGTPTAWEPAIGAPLIARPVRTQNPARCAPLAFISRCRILASLVRKTVRNVLMIPSAKDASMDFSLKE